MTASPRTTRTRGAVVIAIEPGEGMAAEFRWSRTVPVDIHLGNIRSHSIFLVRGAEAALPSSTRSAPTCCGRSPAGRSKRRTASF